MIILYDSYMNVKGALLNYIYNMVMNSKKIMLMKCVYIFISIIIRYIKPLINYSAQINHGDDMLCFVCDEWRYMMIHTKTKDEKDKKHKHVHARNGYSLPHSLAHKIPLQSLSPLISPFTTSLSLLLTLLYD